ncbi:IS110 family transposase [Streptomyces lavendulae]|uniref:IS110 family transposase n=1 Tax=Streptomyces lavendulae TaxID=1914 RepID=UPI0033DF96D6
MKIFCGIDWAEDHHDVALVDERGDLVAKQRISDDLAGLEALQQVLAEAGDEPGNPIPVAIETSRGLLVACLRATGRPLYAINPMAVARYRERRSVARAKSDHADALALANILRTDAEHHRPLPADTELVQAIAVLARAQQDAVWNRQQLANQLRSLLREFFPAALAAFQVKNVGLAHPDARAVLAAAPTPTAAAALSTARLRLLLRKAGRQRRIETRAEYLAGVLREPHMRQLPRVEDALGQQVRALVLQLDAAAQAAADLAAACADRFTEHEDAEIITSFPGLGDLTGARVLAEIGDDRSRFADGRALKAYAGSAPITRASGKSLIVHHRKVKNQRLAAVGYVWAFAALSGSGGARGHYDRRRSAGDRHTAALRNLYNRLLGQLHHCLMTRQNYNEDTAFPTPLPFVA